MSESEKKYGFESLKKVVDFAAKTDMAYRLAKADGSIDISDAHLLMAPTIALFGVFGVIKDVPAEFKDLDEVEKAQLVQYAKDQYDIADDRVEHLIEKGFEAILNLSDLIEDVVSGDSE